jgi:hypothetical protein
MASRWVDDQSGRRASEAPSEADGQGPVTLPLESALRYRSEVNQAVGMIMARFRLDPAEAWQRLHELATSTGQSVPAASMAIVERRLTIE